MSNEQEIKELKETLNKLDARIEQLTAASKRERPSWLNFLIGFVIVFVVMLISVGVVQFFQ